MTKNWKLLFILAGSAVVGATAIAFASDLIAPNVSSIATLGIMSVASNDEPCPPDACSIVLKADGAGDASRVIPVH